MLSGSGEQIPLWGVCRTQNGQIRQPGCRIVVPCVDDFLRGEGQEECGSQGVKVGWASGCGAVASGEWGFWSSTNKNDGAKTVPEASAVDSV